MTITFFLLLLFDGVNDKVSYLVKEQVLNKVIGIS